ncbi:CRACD-like protein isoform X2 [Polyodon spathula]|uniref:CRACD-like protein isoform X2 n=1 Tax=Polyodon spathula TaxID=7913 RepID=UPI001B7D9404|nr:CRACD-like protein isoform X2 [Polyodon spathula]
MLGSGTGVVSPSPLAPCPTEELPTKTWQQSLRIERRTHSLENVNGIKKKNSNRVDFISENHIVATGLMDSKMEEAEGCSEDITGKKKSKFKAFKIRLFGKRKRKEGAASALKCGLKQSQSASDVMAPESMAVLSDSEDELGCPKGVLASRALSHDSIFIPEAKPESPEPARVLSQENVSGKIKALQLKLQQNIRLGPPPLVIPGKRTEDTGTSSEDDGLPRSPPEISPLHESLAHGSAAQVSLQPSSRALSPVAKTNYRTSSPLSPTVQPSNTCTSPIVDFSSPPEFSACLDNSAAKHRLSVKPRNQRAGAKGRQHPSKVHRPRCESLNELDYTVLEKEEEEENEPQEIIRCYSYSSQVPRTEILTALLINKPTVVKASDTVKEQQTEKSTDPAEKENALCLLLNSSSSDNTQDSTFSKTLSPDTQYSSTTWDLNPVTVHAKVETNVLKLETDKTVQVKPVSIRKTQSKNLIKEILNTGAHTGTLQVREDTENFQMLDTNIGDNTLRDVPKSEASSMLGSVNIRESITRFTQDAYKVEQSVTRTKELPSASSRTVNNLHSKDSIKNPKLSPLKTKSLPGELPQKKQSSEPAKKPIDSIPTAEKEDVVTVPADVGRGADVKPLSQQSSFKKMNAGLFQFSISSAWDRPRMGSFTGTDQTEIKKDDSFQGSTSSHPKPNPVVRIEKEETLPKVAKESCEITSKKPEDSVIAAVVKASQGEDNEEKSPFGIKLRSTSLSLKYREGSHPDFNVKRHSTEVCTLMDSDDFTGLPNSGKAGDPKPSDVLGSPFKDNGNIKAKSSEQLNVKTPLLRKPMLQSSGTTDASSVATKSENTEGERLSFHKNSEKGTPTKSMSEVTKETADAKPAWINMARLKQRGYQEQHLSTSKEEKYLIPEVKPDKVKQGEAKHETLRPQSEVWVDRVPSPTQRRATLDHRQDVKMDWKHPPPTQTTALPTAEAVPSTIILISTDKEEKPQLSKDLPVPTAGAGQPPWMELAKKKSQAWNDISMD